MKKIIIILTALATMGNVWGQTAVEWQQDLRHLQNTVHTRYNNLFHMISAEKWDSAVDQFHKSIPSMDKLQVLTGFIKLVSLFHIGHTQVNTWGLHGQIPGGITLNRYPYRLYWFNDGLYITAADKQYEATVGSKIIKIGKLNTADALEAIRPLVAYENELGYKSNAPAFLATPEFLKTAGIADSETELPVTILKNGKEQTVVFKPGLNINGGSATGLEYPEGWVVARKDNTRLPLWQKDPSSYRYYEYLPESKTLYVRHSVTLNDGNKTIESFFNTIGEFIDKNDVQRLILDIRNNGGGNNYLNKSIITTIVAARKINQPGKFYCVLGRRTFSAAQNLTNELEKYTEVTFVGEPTSENVNFYGDTRTETLPNSKLQVSLSWMWWQNLDPRDKRTATFPQLAADMSFADFYNNEDPALAVIDKYGGRQSFMQGISALLEKGKKEEALQMAKEFHKNPVFRYLNERTETDINDAGYRLMNQNKTELASALFELNTKLFPESANTYDSYAESLMKLGKNDDAIRYYEMAIAKDKEGVTAENSRKMIARIKERKGF